MRSWRYIVTICRNLQRRARGRRADPSSMQPPARQPAPPSSVEVGRPTEPSIRHASGPRSDLPWKPRPLPEAPPTALAGEGAAFPSVPDTRPCLLHGLRHPPSLGRLLQAVSPSTTRVITSTTSTSSAVASISFSGPGTSTSSVRRCRGSDWPCDMPKPSSKPGRTAAC